MAVDPGDAILLEREGLGGPRSPGSHVALVTSNRPAVLNALNLATLDRLR